MCVVSMIMEHYHDKWTQPPYNPIPQIVFAPQIPQADIEEFYRLLKRAREYDKQNNQPDCELDSKKEKLTKLAKELGVEITFP